MDKSIFGFKPVTHLATSPYRQIIGEKSYFASIGPDSTPKKFLLKNPEEPNIWFKGGLKVLGVNFVTAITNHPLTKHDSYVITESAARKPLIEFFGSCKKDKKPQEIFGRYDNINIDERGDVIHYVGWKNLELGDKPSNLHGQKGTITHIVDDNRFEVEPYQLDSDMFETLPAIHKKVDILMNFDSVVKRGAFGLFAEICYQEAKEQPTITSPITKLYTGILYDNETETEHECVVGVVHYMILDKLSTFIVNKRATIDRMTYYNLLSNGDEKLWNMLELWKF